MSFFEDNMPTTFMGRDNNNNPCYHVRKTNGLSADAMKSGVQDDTLFHSSLPYLQVVETIDVGVSSITNTGYFNSNYQQMYIFNLPAAVTNLLGSSYGCLATVTWSDGSKSSICMDDSYCISISRYSNGGTALYSSQYQMPLRELGFHGWWGLSYTPNTSRPFPLFQPDDIWDSNYSIGVGYNTTNYTLNTISSHTTHLNPTTKTLIFCGGNGYKAAGAGGTSYSYFLSAPIPSYITFKFLNIQQYSNTMVYSQIVPTGSSILVNRDGLSINNSNILSGRTFLALDKVSSYSRTDIQANGFPTQPKLTTLALPNGYPPFSYLSKFINFTWNYNGFSGGGSIPYIPYVSNNVLGTKEYIHIYTSAYGTPVDSLPFVEMSRSTIPYYITDVFKTVGVPSNSNSCEFSKNYLKVNGITIFDQNTPFIYPTLGTSFIDVPQYNFSVSTTGSNSYYITSFNIARISARLSILFSVSRFDGSYFSASNSNSGLTASISTTARAVYDTLLMKLSSLSNGEMVEICKFSEYFSFESSSSANYYCTVSFIFKRVGDTVQLIRNIYYSNPNNVPNTITMQTPGFRVTYMQLASAF